MVNIERKKLEQVLDALEYASTGNRRPEIIVPAITYIKEALAQPAQEPSLAEMFCKELDKVSQRNYELRMENAALKAQLAQPAQEPMGFMNAGQVYEMQQGRLPYGYVYPKGATGASVAIYTAPPAAQPAQEPVVLVATNSSGQVRMQYSDGSAFDISKHIGQSFYTTPPQRPWVGLDEEEVDDCARGCANHAEFYQAIDAKLKEKNNV